MILNSHSGNNLISFQVASYCTQSSDSRYNSKSHIIHNFYSASIDRQSMKKVPPKAKKVPFKPEDYVRSNLPLSQIEELKDAFDLFDLERTGRIDPKQIRNAMSAVGMDTKNSTFYRNIVNIEKQGALDFPKFLEVMSARKGLRLSRANIKKIFSNFDDEKTGFISQQNLRKLAKDLKCNLTERDFNEMIEKADLDNDGLVSEEEFYLIMTKKGSSR